MDAFEFTSARDQKAGLNMAMFTASALVSCSPEMIQNWLAETTGNQVTFFCKEGLSIRTYDLATFLVDKQLPMPAI